MTKKEEKQRMISALQESAKAWCGKNTSGKVMDIDLAKEFAKILVKHMYDPHLKYARTDRLQKEINLRHGHKLMADMCK